MENNINKSGYWQDIIKLSQGNIAYTTGSSKYDKSEVIFNEKTLGSGHDIALFGNNIAFIKEIDNAPHVIYNGKDLGIGFRPIISGKNIAFLNTTDDKYWHLKLNDEIINSSNSEDNFYKIELFEDELGYILKNNSKEYECYYNKKNIGSCINIFLLKDNFIAVKKDFTLYDKNGKIGTINKGTLKVYENNIAYISHIPNSPDYYAFVNKKNVGTIIQESGEDVVMLSGKNYAFEREIGGKSHIIHNGKDLGEGLNPVLPDMDKYNTTCEIIYDKEDYSEINE